MPLGEDTAPVCWDAAGRLVLFQPLRQRLHVDRLRLRAAGPRVPYTGVGDPHCARTRRHEGHRVSCKAPSLPPGSTVTEFRAGGVARGQPGGEAGSQEVRQQSGNLQPGSSRRAGMRAGREDPADGPVEGWEEAPGRGGEGGGCGVGDGEEWRDPQRFSPRHRAGLKLDLLLLQREDGTLAGAACQQNSALLPRSGAPEATGRLLARVPSLT